MNRGWSTGTAGSLSADHRSSLNTRVHCHGVKSRQILQACQLSIILHKEEHRDCHGDSSIKGMQNAVLSDPLAAFVAHIAFEKELGQQSHEVPVANLACIAEVPGSEACGLIQSACSLPSQASGFSWCWRSMLAYF